MEPIDRYLSLVMRTTSVSFSKDEAGVFLLKRPDGKARSDSIPAQISYETNLGSVEQDPFAAEWRIAPVKKREGNPYADRISIGRATNCDVVLRVPFISKMQAHILFGPDGSYSLRAHSAASATFLNGHKIDPSSARPLRVGDTISFGSMTFEFVDAARLYQVLANEAYRHNSDRS